jgi:NAD(P)H dehydrogenase (quinone)
MELACQSVLTVLVNFGFLVFGVTDYASRDLTLHYGAVSAKAPADEAAKGACRLLGHRLAAWTAVYVHGVANAHPGLTLAERRPPHA